MKSLGRFFVICQGLIPLFIVFTFTKNNPESKRFKKTIINIRFALQDLGITFIKLGQLLSARPDIVGLELSQELRNLLDEEPIIPFSIVTEIIEKESGMPLSKVYKKIDHEPIGTASIAQVQKGMLLSGHPVAIKVQRPGIEKVIQNDLPVFKTICKIIDSLTPHSSLKFSYLYQEFVEWVTNELDFSVEGKRADKFRENMADIEGVSIPRVYWEHTTKRVLVMSYVEGLTVNQLLNIMKNQHAPTLYDVKLDYKINPDLLIKRTVESIAKQALVDKFFHGDLHPANIIVQKNNKIAFVDFGIIGSLDAEEHAQILFILLAIVQDNPEALLKVLQSLIVSDLSKEDLGKLHQQLADELHSLHESSGSKVGLNHFISMLFIISRKYSMTYSKGLIIALKTIAQIDSVAGQIGLRSSLIEILKPEVEKCMTQMLSSEISKETVYNSLFELVEAGKKLPQTLTELEKLINHGELAKVKNFSSTPSTASFLQTGVLAMSSLIVSFPIVMSAPVITSTYRNIITIATPLLLFFVFGKIFEGRKGVN